MPNERKTDKHRFCFLLAENCLSKAKRVSKCRCLFAGTKLLQTFDAAVTTALYGRVTYVATSSREAQLT
jgi:hypothetical protein